MPTQRQITTEFTPTTYEKGGSDTTVLNVVFNTSPLHSDDMSADAVRARYEELVLNGEVQNGYGFSSFSRDYNGAPDYTEWEGAVAAPASAWVPNPNSPGEGSVNPNDKPTAPDGYGVTPSEGAFGGGPSTTPSETNTPQAAAQKFATQAVHGLTLGKSRFSE